MSREIDFPSFPLFAHLPQNRRALTNESKEIMLEAQKMGLQVGSVLCLFSLPTSRFMGEVEEGANEEKEGEVEPRGAGFMPSWSRAEVMEGERKMDDDLTPNMFLKRQVATFWNLISENTVLSESGVYCHIVLFSELIGECYLRLKENGMRMRFSLGGAGIGSLSAHNDQYFYRNFARFADLILPNGMQAQVGGHYVLEIEDSATVNAYFRKMKTFFNRFGHFAVSFLANHEYDELVRDCKDALEDIQVEGMELNFPFSALLQKSIIEFRSHFPNLPFPWILDPNMIVSNRSIVPYHPSFGIDPSFLPLAYETSEGNVSHPFLSSEFDFSLRLSAKKRRRLISCLTGEETSDPNIQPAIMEAEENVARGREAGDESFEHSIHCNLQFLLQFCAEFQMRIIEFGFSEGRRMLDSPFLMKDERSVLFREFSLIPIPEFLLFKKQLESLRTRADSRFFSLFSQNMYFSDFRYTQLYSSIRIYRLFNWIEFWGMKKKEAYLLDAVNGLMMWSSAERLFSFFRNNERCEIGRVGTWVCSKLGLNNTDSFGIMETISSFVNAGKAFVLVNELDPEKKYLKQVERLVEFEIERIRHGQAEEERTVSLQFPSEMVVSIFEERVNSFYVWKIKKISMQELTILQREEGWKERVLIDYREEGKLLDMAFGSEEIKPRRVFDAGFFPFSVENSIGSIIYRAFPSIVRFESFSELMRNCVSEISLSSSCIEDFLSRNKFGPGQGNWNFSLFDSMFPINTRVRLMISLSYLSVCALLRGFNKIIIQKRVFPRGLPGGDRSLRGRPDLNSGKFRNLMYLQMQRAQGEDERRENNIAYSISFPSMLDLSRNLAFYSISLRSMVSDFEDFSSYIAQTGGSYQVFGYTNQTSKVFPICFGVGVLTFQFFPDPRSGVVPMAGSLPFPARNEFIQELKALGLDEKQGVYDISTWTKKILNAADPEMIPYLPEGVTREDVVQKFVSEGKGNMEGFLMGNSSPFSFPSAKELLERNASLFGGCCWFNAVISGLKDIFEHQIFRFDGVGLCRFSKFVKPEKLAEMNAGSVFVLDPVDFNFEDFYQALIVEWILSFRLKRLFSASMAVSDKKKSAESMYPYSNTPLFDIQKKFLEDHVLAKKKVTEKKEEEITLVGGRMNIEDQRNALDWLCLIIAGMFGFALQIRLREVKYKEDLDYLQAYSEEGKVNLKKFSNSFSVSVSSGIKRKQALKKEEIKFEFPNATSFRNAAHSLIMNTDERVYCANVPIVEVKLLYLYQHVFNISSLQGSEQIFNFCVNLKKYFLFPDDNDEIGCYDLGYTNSVKDQLKWINDNFSLFCERFLNQKYSSYFFSLSPREKDAFQKTVINVMAHVKKQYDQLIDYSKGEEKKMECQMEEEEETFDLEGNETFARVRVGVNGKKIPFITDKISSIPVNLDEQNEKQMKEQEILDTFALILDFETYISGETISGETDDLSEETKQEAVQESIQEGISILEDDFGLENENVEEQKNGTLDDVLAFSSKPSSCGKVNIGRVVPYAFGLCSNRTMKENNNIYLWMKEGGTINLNLKGEMKKMFYFNADQMVSSEIDIKDRVIPWGHAFWCGVFTETLRHQFLPIVKRKFLSSWMKYQDYLTSEQKKVANGDEELYIPSWKEFVVQDEGRQVDSEFSVISTVKGEENQMGIIDPIPVYAHNGARFDFFFLLKSAGYFDFIRILKHSGFIQIIAQMDNPLSIPKILDKKGYEIFCDWRVDSASEKMHSIQNCEEDRLQLRSELWDIFTSEMEIFSSYLQEQAHCEYNDIMNWIFESYFPVEWKVKTLGKDMKRKNVYSNILKEHAYSQVKGKGKRKYEELLPAMRGFNGMFESAMKSIVLSFQDSYRIAPLPLRVLCASYHCSVQKGIFPYSILTEKLYSEKIRSFFTFFKLVCGRAKREVSLLSEGEELFDSVLKEQKVEVQSADFANGEKDLEEFKNELARLDENAAFGMNEEKRSFLSLLSNFGTGQVTYPVLFALVEYLINDVFGLEEVVKKHCSALVNAFHCDPYRTLTLPSYAFKFLASTNVLADASFASSIPVDLFIRRGIKGGATMLTSHKFSLADNYLCWARKTGASCCFPPNDERELQALSLKSKESSFPYYFPIEGEELDLKKLMKFYKTCSTFGALSNLDVNSLYPSAMTMFPLPSGDAYWLGGEHENLQVMDCLKFKWKNYDFSAPLMVMCDFEYGKKNSLLPLIGEKRSPGKDVFASVPRMMYDFVPKTACVLSTPEIEILYRFYQGKITKIYGVIMFTEWTYSIGALIYEIYQKRVQFKKEKNPIELAYKLIMNSLYGKWIQQYPDSKLSIFDLQMNMSRLMDGFESSMGAAASIASHLFDCNRNINANWREFSYLCVSMFDTVRSMVFLSNGQCVVEQKMLKFNGAYSLNDSRIIPSGCKTSETAVGIPSVWGVYVLGNSKLIDARYLSMLNQGDQIRFYETGGVVQLGNGCYYMDTDSFHIDVRVLTESLVNGEDMKEVDEKGYEYYGKDMRKPNVQNCFKIGKELGNISSDIEVDSRIVDFFKANYEEEYLALCDSLKSELSPQESLVQFLLFKFFSGVPCYITEGCYVATKTYCEQVMTLLIGDESKGQDKRKLYWGSKVHMRAKGINVKDIYALIGSSNSKDILNFYSSLVENDMNIESHQLSFAAGTKASTKYDLSGYNVSKSQKCGRKWISRPTVPDEFIGDVRNKLTTLLMEHSDISEFEGNEWVSSILSIWNYFEESTNKYVFDTSQMVNFLLHIRVPYGWSPIKGSLMNFQVARMTGNSLFNDQVQKKKVSMGLFDNEESKFPAAASMMSVLSRVVDSKDGEEECKEEEKAMLQANDLCKFLAQQGKFNFGDKECPFVVNPNVEANW